MSKESIRQARIEPSGVQGVNCPVRHTFKLEKDAKKQSDGLAVLVIKTKSKWWKILHVMGRF